MADILPSTGYPAIDWIIVGGALAAALAGIWRTVVRPTMRAYARIDEYGPVLTEIAKQFKSDSGSTLKDVIGRLEVAAQRNLKAIEAADARAASEAATLARMEVAIAVLEGRLTGAVRATSSEQAADVAAVKLSAAADAATDKVKATAADAAAALVEVVNPRPIKVEVINDDPIDVRDSGPEDEK